MILGVSKGHTMERIPADFFSIVNVRDGQHFCWVFIWFANAPPNPYVACDSIPVWFEQDF